MATSDAVIDLVDSPCGHDHAAVNIEHHVERLGAFVTIVLGEMVANVFYKSVNATGLNS